MIQRTFIALFAVIHIVILTMWGLPSQSLPLQNQINEITRKYLLFTGLWQGWDMFAPNPFALNAKLSAQVTMEKGTLETWTFPQPEEKWGLIRYRKERFRKWAIDRVRTDDYRWIWKDTSHFAARQVYESTGLRPVKVALIRHWSEILPPDTIFLKLNELKNDTPNSYEFYSTPILAKDIGL